MSSGEEEPQECEQVVLWAHEHLLRRQIEKKTIPFVAPLHRRKPSTPLDSVFERIKKRSERIHKDLPIHSQDQETMPEDQRVCTETHVQRLARRL